MTKILIADDEKDIVEMVKYNLSKEGFSVLTASNGRQAIDQAEHRPDLILLDIMMPELDGWEVLKRLRKNPRTAEIPVVFLTARSGEIDEVLGLELGADDYIVKPISIPKLVARVKHALRRAEAPERRGRKRVALGAVEISPAEHTVRIGGKEVFFPKKEYEVLLYLAEHAGELVSREMLLARIWGSDVLVVDRTVDVHIRKIREKLGKHADMIETVKGAGYRMREHD